GDTGVDEVIDPPEAIPLQAERDPVLGAADHLVRAGVEYAHLTAAVFALRDRSRERGVLHRVVLGADGQVPLAALAGQALRHRPGPAPRGAPAGPPGASVAVP